MRRPIPSGWSRSEIAPGTEDVSPAATPLLAVFPKSFPSTFIFPAVPLLRRRCCEVCWRCSNGSTQAPLRLDNHFDFDVCAALRECRELGAAPLNSPSPFEGSRG